MSSIVLFHFGAGNHSSNKYRQYKQLADSCGNKFHHQSIGTTPALEQLELISQLIEDSELTNTGYGSSLTMNKTVESDSSVLLYCHDHDTKKTNGVYIQSSIALHKGRYPITESINLLRDQSNKNQFGITKPNFMVDTSKHDPEMVSKRSIEKWEYYDNMMKAQHKDNDTTIRVTEAISDTIGIIISNDSTTISGCSSGGNFFKPEGRIGCAAIIGASHYTLQRQSKDNNQELLLYRISLMCSGNGEDIVAMDLSRYCCGYILDHIEAWELEGNASYSELLLKSIQTRIEQVQLQAVDQKNGEKIKPYLGVYGLLEIIIIDKEKEKEKEKEKREKKKLIIIMCHSTETFIGGYSTTTTTSDHTNSSMTKLIISRLDNDRTFTHLERYIG